MPTTKKGDSDSINDSDKTTMHNAGVDVPSLAPTPEENAVKEETIVDIDGGTPSPADPALK